VNSPGSSRPAMSPCAPTRCPDRRRRGHHPHPSGQVRCRSQPPAMPRRQWPPRVRRWHVATGRRGELDDCPSVDDRYGISWQWGGVDQGSRTQCPGFGPHRRHSIGVLRWALPAVALIGLIAGLAALLIGRRDPAVAGHELLNLHRDQRTMTTSNQYHSILANRTKQDTRPARPAEKESTMQRVEHQLKIVLIRQRRAIRTLAGVLIAAGGVCLAIAASATAATLGATATVATPGSLTPLSSGGSATVFTVTLPANAACTGDTASRGYHVYSYLVPKAPMYPPSPSSTAPRPATASSTTPGCTTERQHGHRHRADRQHSQRLRVGTPGGQRPRLTLHAALHGGNQRGVGRGIACATPTGSCLTTGAPRSPSKAAAGDPNGFTWSAVPGGGTTSTTTTTTSTTSTTHHRRVDRWDHNHPGFRFDTTVAGSTTGTTTAGGRSGRPQAVTVRPRPEVPAPAQAPPRPPVRCPSPVFPCGR